MFGKVAQNLLKVSIISYSLIKSYEGRGVVSMLENGKAVLVGCFSQQSKTKRYRGSEFFKYHIILKSFHSAWQIENNFYWTCLISCLRYITEHHSWFETDPMPFQSAHCKLNRKLVRAIGVAIEVSPNPFNKQLSYISCVDIGDKEEPESTEVDFGWRSTLNVCQGSYNSLYFLIMVDVGTDVWGMI